MAGAAENIAFASQQQSNTSLDALNGSTFCDSTSGSMIMTSDSDDAGWVPANKGILKCETSVGKNRVKLGGGVLKCHSKMASAFFKAKDFDEEGCETTNTGGSGAFDKYTKTATKLAGGACLTVPCQSLANQTAEGTSDTNTLDGLNGLVYPCNLGP